MTDRRPSHPVTLESHSILPLFFGFSGPHTYRIHCLVVRTLHTILFFPPLLAVLFCNVTIHVQYAIFLFVLARLIVVFAPHCYLT